MFATYDRRLLTRAVQTVIPEGVDTRDIHINVRNVKLQCDTD